MIKYHFIVIKHNFIMIKYHRAVDDMCVLEGGGGQDFELNR